MNAAGASDGGNRTVFKPSPLKGMKESAVPAAAATIASASQAEVTAVPLANPRPPSRGHDDLTTFSPGAAMPPVAPAPEAPVKSGPPPKEDKPGRGSLVWLVAALVLLVLILTLVLPEAG